MPTTQVDEEELSGAGGGGCSMSVDNQLPPQLPTLQRTYAS